MKPPRRGPAQGPRKGARVKMAIGTWSSFGVNRSPTVPPDTVRNVLPEKPSRNRQTMMVVTFLATACGMDQMTYTVQATR